MGGYNNPLMAGIVDAVALGADPAQITCLSLGTGTGAAAAARPGASLDVELVDRGPLRSGTRSPMPDGPGAASPTIRRMPPLTPHTSCCGILRAPWAASCG